MNALVLCPGTNTTPLVLDPTPDLPAGIVGVTTMGLCGFCERSRFVRDSDGLIDRHGHINIEAPV